MSRFKRPMTYKEIFFQQYGYSIEEHLKKQRLSYKEIQKKKQPCK